MEAVRNYLQKDAFVQHINIDLVNVEPGRATARLTIHPHHLNAYGIVQGGAIFTVADYAFAAASNSHGSVAVGISVSIQYLKAARSGTLTAEAREVAINPKLGSYLVEVRDDTKDLVALFQGLVYRKKEAIA